MDRYARGRGRERGRGRGRGRDEKEGERETEEEEGDGSQEGELRTGLRDKAEMDDLSEGGAKGQKDTSMTRRGTHMWHRIAHDLLQRCVRRVR